MNVDRVCLEDHRVDLRVIGRHFDSEHYVEVYVDTLIEIEDRFI